MDLRITRFIDKYVGIPICYFLLILDSVLNTIKVPFIKKNNKDIKKILLIKFWGFGNIILMMPTVFAIRMKYPQARIDFLTLSDNKSIIEVNKVVDDVLTVPLKTVSSFIEDFFKLIFRVRGIKYDLVVDFEQFARSSSILTYLSGAALRVGFDTLGTGRGRLYSCPVKYNDNQHIVETFFDLAFALGSEKQKLALHKITAGESDVQLVEEFIQKNNLHNKKLVGVHVGTGPNAQTRRWPLKNYLQLTETLIKEKGVFVLLTGSNSEFEVVQEILNGLIDFYVTSCINVCGKFTLPQLAYLIEKMTLFISSDTGPLHLAVAQRIPTVSFYGPNTPLVYGPWGNKKKNVVFYKNFDCSPCMSNYNDKLSRCIHKEPYCITQINPADVFSEIIRNKLL